MTKIQKVDLNLGKKIINPFKTTRNSSSNPFKYQDFEGNTLDLAVCADVFESAKTRTNKLKMITSSVMGSMTKLRTSITEPIIKFVKRIGTGISSAWDYAKSTNISDVAGIKLISDTLNTDIVDLTKGISHSISDSLSGLGKGISDRMSFLNTDVTELGKGISETWSSIIGKINHNRITKDTTVAELRTMWQEELAKLSKEAA